MKDTLGLILTGRTDDKPNELTRFRTAAALPVAGRYRLVDFTLSSFANSGITNVGVAIWDNAFSLIGHIGTGAAWDLNRRAQGLKIIYPDAREVARTLSGIADFLKNSRQKYVLIGEGNIVINENFTQLLQFHREKRADISVMYTRGVSDSELSESDVLEFDTTGRLYALEKCPRTPLSKNASINIYLMERRFLMRILEDSAVSGRDFLTDCIIRRINDWRIFGYRFSGYVKRVHGVCSYCEANMDMLREDVRREVFGGENKIYTAEVNLPPTLYGDGAQVSDSFVADGCHIDGEVSDSIIFGGVRIEKDVKIKNCILMEKSFIGSGSSLEHVVLDKDCVIREGTRLCGQESFPVIIGKGAVV